MTTLDGPEGQTLHPRSWNAAGTLVGVEGAMPLRDAATCPRCGTPAGRRESDPSLMLGLVMLVVANALVVAALAAAVVWIVA